MGGSLFSIERIGQEELNKIQTDVFKKIGSPEMTVPRTFNDKKDYGDLDICLYSPVIDTGFLMDQFNLSKDQISINDTVISFQYNNMFQIDLCHFPEEDFKSAVNYMSFGDLSNMIGVICNRAFGMRYTHRGLVAPVKLHASDMLGEVVISKDVERIFEFIDLNYSEWKTGFNNELEAFQWIMKSKYFNPDFFAFENLNHQNKTRNRKRKMYSRFVEYLSVNDVKNHYDIPENKTEHLWRSILHFNYNWTVEANKLIEERRIIQERSKKFNGNLVSEWIGESGIVLGLFLRAFIEFIKVNDCNFNEFVDKNTTESIEKIVKEFYKLRTTIRE